MKKLVFLMVLLFANELFAAGFVKSGDYIVVRESAIRICQKTNYPFSKGDLLKMYMIKRKTDPSINTMILAVAKVDSKGNRLSEFYDPR